MSLDFKIAILLAQLKDDPRFQQVTKTGPLLVDAALNSSIGDPLTSSAVLNTPTLSGFSSSGPIFLSVDLDLFHIIKIDLENAGKAKSILELLHITKGISNKLKASEITDAHIKPRKEEILNILSAERIELQKGQIENKTKIQDFLEFLKLGKTEFPFDVLLFKGTQAFEVKKSLQSGGRIDTSHIDLLRFIPPSEDFSKVQENIIRPAKLRTTKDNIFASFKSSRKLGKLKESKAQVKIGLDPFKVTKGIFETTRTTDFIVPAKLVTSREQLKVLFENRLKVGIPLFVKTETKSEKDHLDVVKKTFELGQLKESILTPTSIQILKEDALAKIFKRLRVTKLKESIVQAISREDFKVVKRNETLGNIQDFILPVKIKTEINKAKVKTKERKLFATEFNKQLLSIIDSRLKFSTNLNDLQNIKSVLITAPVKQRLPVEIVSASQKIAFDRSFKIHFSAEILDTKQAFDVIKVNLSKLGGQSKLILPTKHLFSAEKAKVRATREELDLRYLFNPHFTELLIQLNANNRDNFTLKSIIDLHKMKVASISFYHKNRRCYCYF